MPLWRAIVLMSLALMIGIGLGYVRWGREARRLQEAAALGPEARQQPVGAVRRWTVRGVVRILLREQAVVFLTHESVPGLIGGATRAFPVASPKLLDSLSPGDPVRFTIERRGMQVVVVSIEREGAH
jgi:Cu/Ag efflux protein CusF